MPLMSLWHALQRAGSGGQACRLNAGTRRGTHGAEVPWGHGARRTCSSAASQNWSIAFPRPCPSLTASGVVESRLRSLTIAHRYGGAAALRRVSPVKFRLRLSKGRLSKEACGFHQTVHQITPSPPDKEAD
ncbi:hypothetical protein AAFF_G00107700 [Aldrovandia affinis]|uniref:Uncharacterized protein n=1 Tax=Aldrovandia affinis TaxID=143900 RepID=A0AAD7RU06_9TELE|nr:hypothetical protein AAFF_G00107700 [Aldrovandia affinis]